MRPKTAISVAIPATRLLAARGAVIACSAAALAFAASSMLAILAAGLVAFVGILPPPAAEFVAKIAPFSEGYFTWLSDITGFDATGDSFARTAFAYSALIGAAISSIFAVFFVTLFKMGGRAAKNSAIGASCELSAASAAMEAERQERELSSSTKPCRCEKQRPPDSL